jgi:hypothetical protein
MEDSTDDKNKKKQFEKTTKTINKLYDNLHFFDLYGGSVFIFILLIVILISVAVITSIMKQIGPVKDDWAAKRCDPRVIPFAGFINKPDESTIVEFTGDNFNYCLQNILTTVTGYAVDPLTYVTNGLQDLYNGIANIINTIRTMLSNIRTYISNIAQEIMQRIANIIVPIQKIVIAFTDSMQKVQGVLAAGLYTALGSYYTLKTVMGAVMQLVVAFLIALLAIIVVLFVMMYFIPTYIYTFGTAVAMFTAISVPLVIMMACMNSFMHIPITAPIPSLPSCFDKDTNIEMKDGKTRRISELQVGDVLKNNVQVTAIIQLDRGMQEMYRINNIVVSGSHRILYQGKWIYVSDCPERKRIDDYKEPYLYCLNTTSKTIDIMDTLFCDWDEVFDKEIHLLSEKMGFPISKQDIHLWFDHGFLKDTEIIVDSNSRETKKIQDIKVGDSLYNGEIKVYGIVFVSDNVTSDNDLGSSQRVLYHLLTDKGVFYIKEDNGDIQKRRDYNYCIESFL